MEEGPVRAELRTLGKTEEEEAALSLEESRTGNSRRASPTDPGWPLPAPRGGTGSSPGGSTAPCLGSKAPCPAHSEPAEAGSQPAAPSPLGAHGYLAVSEDAAQRRQRLGPGPRATQLGLEPGFSQLSPKTAWGGAVTAKENSNILCATERPMEGGCTDVTNWEATQGNGDKGVSGRRCGPPSHPG